MRKNKAKEKMLRGEPIFMCMLLSHAPSMVEVLARAGIDIICIDGEHGPLDRQTLENLVRACECADVTPIFRTTLNYPAEILPFLDTGVMGLEVPHCTTAAKAKMAVDALKYAPLGKRGMTPGRANAYAVSGMSAKEYIEASNRETLILTQIEDVEGLKNLPEIIKVEGIDVVDIGPGDLSNSLGYPGQRAHPKVLEAIEHIIDMAHSVGRISDNPAPNAELRKKWFAKGAHIITSGDLRMLFDSASAQVRTILDSVK